MALLPSKLLGTSPKLRGIATSQETCGHSDCKSDGSAFGGSNPSLATERVTGLSEAGAR